MKKSKLETPLKCKFLQSDHIRLRLIYCTLKQGPHSAVNVQPKSKMDIVKQIHVLSPQKCVVFTVENVDFEGTFPWHWPTQLSATSLCLDGKVETECPWKIDFAATPFPVNRQWHKRPSASFLLKYATPIVSQKWIFPPQKKTWKVQPSFPHVSQQVGPANQHEVLSQSHPVQHKDSNFTEWWRNS